MKKEEFAFPTSFAQQRLWFLEQLSPGNSHYNIPVLMHLRGSLNVPVLTQSINEIVQRHEALRTTFAIVDEQPVQIVAKSLTLPLPVVELRELPEASREVEAQRLVREEARRPFDLTSGPLIRCTLLQLDFETQLLLIVVHHIIFDAWSQGVFFQELKAFYEAYQQGKPSPLPELPIQYADFAIWQRQWLQGEMLESQLTFWKEQLAGVPPLLELPTDRSRPVMQTFRGATETFTFSQEHSKALKALSQQEGATLFMTLLAAFKLLLYRYTEQKDIVVGTPVANRNQSEIEGLIGFFINTLVIRTSLSGHLTFRQLLRQVREVSLDAYTHQDLPFEKLVETLQPERNLSHNPLFQVMFVFQNAPAEQLEFGTLKLTRMEVDSKTAKFDLTLNIEETAQGLRGAFEYNTDLFDARTVMRMVGHFQTVLSGIVTNPEQQLFSFPLLTEAERHQLLVEWNDTQTEYPKQKSIHELFEAQVEQTPSAIAVTFGDQKLTYQELNQRSNQLAHYLQKLGVGPEVLVGICMERSLEVVVAIFGILKAGGAYVPLDPTYPEARLTFMLEDAQAPVLVTLKQFLNSFPDTTCHTVCLDTDWQIIGAENRNNLTLGVRPNNLAYVIYTSGSTGRPKGVAIAHRSTVAMVAWAQTVFTAEELAGVLASTSICFDLSVFEMFVPLSIGGQVILAKNALYLPYLTNRDEVTLVNTVPSAMASLVSGNEWGASIRTVNLAGEVLHNTLAQRVYQQADVKRVFNLYGPSEDTTYSTFALVEKESTCSPLIGRPIANTQVYLLDKYLQPVPTGVIGELYLGGDGLVRGYKGRPELTADRFIPNPFAAKPGARLYKTGDLACYQADGNIKFLGRIDHQVKVRGFRIELGEIETVLNRYPGVQETVVVAREEESDTKRLVAYVVAKEDHSLLISQLRPFLKEELPDYMVPAAFVQLEALPLTPNGKVDRRALPAPDKTQRAFEKTYVAPRTAIEKKLAEIWAEVLHLEKVGIHENFFELGGHSLMAIHVIAQANQQGIQMTPMRFFQNPTIAELVKVTGREKIVAEQGLVTGIVPLLPKQFDFLRLNVPNPHIFVIWILLDSNFRIYPNIFKKVIENLLLHHDALRARFTHDETGWHQFFSNIENTSSVFSYEDISVLSESDQDVAIQTKALELREKINLSVGPLIQISLFERSEHTSSILIIANHLVVDSVSINILLKDIESGYLQLIRENAIKFPDKTTSIKYFSERLNGLIGSMELRQELDYWLKMDLTKVGRLPRDFPEGSDIGKIDVVSISMSVEESAKILTEIPTAYDIQTTDILVSGIVHTFIHWSGNQSLLLRLVKHGREPIFEEIDLTRTVAFLAVNLILLFDVKDARSIEDTLIIVKEQLRQAPTQGHKFTLGRLLSNDTELTKKLQLCYKSLEVHFNFDISSAHALSLSTMWTKSKVPLRVTRQSPRLTQIRIYGGIDPQGKITLNFRFNNNNYNRKTIELLSQRLIHNIKSIVALYEIEQV